MVTGAAAATADDLRVAHQRSTVPISVALLGAGHVGSALAREAARPSSPLAGRVRIAAALVRDADRPRVRELPPAVLTTNAERILDSSPDVVVEVLGGVDVPFALVSRALARGIPVVTANKSLMAARGRELAALAARAGVPLLYEAAVVAGVPFLGSFARRPLARNTSRITGILNGTSNFVLTRMDTASVDFTHALAAARQLGLAEPDPRNDVDGIDAAEKLVVLLRHFGWLGVSPSALEVRGIGAVSAPDIAAARDLGGTLKPVAFADRTAQTCTAFVGPAFVARTHRLSVVAHEENALILRGSHGELFYSGPGAGPDATAATVLDDVVEAATVRPGWPAHDLGDGAPAAPSTDWFVRLEGAGDSDDARRPLPPPEDIADLLASHDIWLRRTAGADAHYCALTHRATREAIERALDSLRSACGCRVVAYRALEG